MTITTKNYQIIQKLEDGEYLLLHPETNAENVVVVIEGIDADNLALALTKLKENIDNKASIDSIPDVSQFITRTVSDLINYYTTSAVDEKIADLEGKISAIPKFSVKVVEERPSEDISETTIYLLKTSDDSENLFTEYIYVDGKWEALGVQSLKLDGYATEHWVNIKLAEFITEERVKELIGEIGAQTTGTADKLSQARKISISGDAVGETTFDGSEDSNIDVALSKTGVQEGVYSVVAVDEQGRVTGGSQAFEIGVAGQTTPSDKLAIGGLFFKMI